MISREDLVTQSVTDLVKAALVARGYAANTWLMVESFSGRVIAAELEGGKQVIAAGFNFDAPPVAAEIGSTLQRRVYHIEFYVFGSTATWARNLASVIKFAVDEDGTGGSIPLYDYAQTGAPQIDVLEVIGSTSRREPIGDPEPWQEFVWLTAAQVEDTYDSRLA